MRASSGLQRLGSSIFSKRVSFIVFHLFSEFPTFVKNIPMSSSIASNESTQPSVESREVEENLTAPLWKYVTKHKGARGGGNIPFTCSFCKKKLQVIIF